MAKIKSVSSLRNYLLETIDQFAEGTIEIQQAAVASKLCDEVLHTIKSEMEYAKARKEVISIPFMNESDRTIERKEINYLSSEHEENEKKPRRHLLNN